MAAPGAGISHAANTGINSFAKFSNPPFDPRRLSTNPYYANLQQGFIISNDNSHKLNFMFNPSTFHENWQPATNFLPDSITGAVGTDTASLVGALPATSDFSLLFDRTYEVNAIAGEPYSHLSGVNVDVIAAKRLCGIIADDGSINPMTYQACTLYLGDIHSVTFKGWITSLDITYTHFTSNMVPVRAALNLSMTLVIGGDPSPSAPGSYSGAHPTASNPTGITPLPPVPAPVPGEPPAVATFTPTPHAGVSPPPPAPTTRSDLPGPPATRFGR